MRCPLCGTGNRPSRPVLAQELDGGRLQSACVCAQCGLWYLDDCYADRSAVYAAGYAAWGNPGAASDLVAEAKLTAFRQQLKFLVRPAGDAPAKLLDVGTGAGYLLDAASELGWEVYGCDTSADAVRQAAVRHPGRIFHAPVASLPFAPGTFQAITLTDVLEHVSDPISLFRAIRRLLAPGGTLLVITPDVDAWSRRLLGRQWFQFKHEHVTYWNRKSLVRLAEATGFRVVQVRGNVKKFSFAYYRQYFRKYGFIWPIPQLFEAISCVMPSWFGRLSFANPVTGELIAVLEAAGESRR